MLKKIIPLLFTSLSTTFIGCTQNKPALKNQYMLAPHMVINENGCGYGTRVADEQNTSSPETFWDGHDKELCRQYTPSLIINLNRKIYVTDVYLFCKDASEVTITVLPAVTKPAAAKIASGWNKINVNSQAAYVKITFTKGSKLGEVLVDADQKYGSEQKPHVNTRKTPFQEFLGTNAFVDVPPALLEPFGCVREYHDWPDWNEPVRDSFYLQTSKQGFDFKNFYINMNKAGKTVIPVLQKSPKWLTGELNVQCRPVAKGGDPLKASSYERHALYLNKYAGLFSEPSGGGLKYIENWNEPDKWWEGNLSYFTPYQYAAMSSADKDGHLTKMGKGKGILAPGKKNKLVMAGLANPKTDYLHALKFWCDQNRNGDFAWDVINYHRYSNSSGLPDNQPRQGICPEEAGLYQEAREIIEFRNRYLPEVEVWLSEFGYDAEKSPQQSKAIGEKTGDLVQADWLIRTYLLLSAAGVDKAFQFMIRDFGKEGLYATSGLYSTTLKQKAFLRPAWNYINTLKGALQNTAFENMKIDSAKKIYTLRFANLSNPEIKTDVIWCGTANGSSSDYKLNFQGSVEAIRLTPHQPCGTRENLTGNNLKISETPVIIQAKNVRKTQLCYTIKPVNIAEIKCLNLAGTPSVTLIDEQKDTREFLFGLNLTSPSSSWKTDYQNKAGNGIVFYLSTKKNIHSIQLFDGAGNGEVQISIKNDQDWKPASTVKMDLYNKWKTVVLNKEVKEIKIEKVKGGPEVGEIILYEMAQDQN